MTLSVRRVALGLVLSVAMFGGAALSTAPASAQSCDPSYPEYCIPPIEEIGYLDCAAVGVTEFTVLPPDPHGFDADFDGIGCEPYSEPYTEISMIGEAMPLQTGGCDPSYPEVCLASSPDLDCAAVGFALSVIYDPNIGAYDPHGLDGDYDGVGCEG